MNALSRLITRALARQFQQARTSDETNAVLQRTIAFAEGTNPYISEEQVDSLIQYVPVTEPETASVATEDMGGAITPATQETAPEGGSGASGDNSEALNG